MRAFLLIRLCCLISLGICLIPGCRNAPTNPTDGAVDNGAGERNGVTEKRVRLRIESESGPIHVPLKVTPEETNGAEIKVAIKPSAESAQPISVPIQIQPAAGPTSPVKFPIVLQPEGGEVKTITVPLDLKLAGDAKQGGETKSITVPIQLKPTDEKKPISVPFELKFDDTKKPEIKVAITPSITKPAPVILPVTIQSTVKDARYEHDSFDWFSGLIIAVSLFICGGFGGLCKGFFAATDVRTAWRLTHVPEDVSFRPFLSGTVEEGRTKQTQEELSRWIEFERTWPRNVVYGIVAAALMPFLLYLVRGDVFTQAQPTTLMIVLFSACFAAGFIGAALLRQFDRLVLTTLGGNRE